MAERWTLAGSAGGPDPVADGQMLQADHERRVDPFGLTGLLDRLEPAREFPPQGPLRALGEVGTEAVVLADTEAEMAVLLAVDPELEGVVEHVLVAIGGGVEHHEAVARGDLPAAHHGVLRGRALHVVDR